MSRFRILAISLFFMCNNGSISAPSDEGLSQTPEWVWEHLRGVKNHAMLPFALRCIKSDLPDGLEIIVSLLRDTGLLGDLNLEDLETLDEGYYCEMADLLVKSDHFNPKDS